MKKRLLSAILSFCMLLTMAPTVAFAADGDDEAAPQINSVLKGSCGAEGNEGSVQWALTDDDGDGSYTLTISGSGAMANYTANINNGSATQPWRASLTGVEISNITKVVVSKGVTSIGAFAFNGLTAVSEYDIGADVSTIKQWALDTSAAKVFNLNGNTNFQTDVDGVLFNKNKDGTTLIAYPGGSAVRDEYTVPSAVTAISDGAFVGCPIKKLTIGSNVTTELPGWSFNSDKLEELDVNCPFGSVYGDNVFEKDGIRRDRTGDGEKTRCLCGKRGIFNRDGPAMGPQIIRQLERRASRRSASFFHALASPGRPRNGGGASGAYQPAEGRKTLIQGRFRAQEGPLGPSRKSQQQTKRTGFAALEDSIADEAPEGKRAKRANRALNCAGINSRGQKQGFGGADRRGGHVTSR